jgi:hypothetical protein
MLGFAAAKGRRDCSKGEFTLQTIKCLRRLLRDLYDEIFARMVELKTTPAMIDTVAARRVHPDTDG